MSKTVLLIDGNNSIHRAYHKYMGMKSKAGESSSIVYGFPLIVGGLLKKFKPDDVVVVFDGGRNKNRLKLLPTYKAREPRLDFDPESFDTQLQIARDLMTAFGVKTVREKGQEADDLIYLLIRAYKKLGYDNIIIASRDKDFRQLITSKVSIWVVTDDIRVTKDNIVNIYGTTPRQSLDYLILDGDKSDKIPGYPGFGEKTIKEFLNKYTSIQKYLDSREQFKKVDNVKLETIYKLNTELIGIKFFAKKHLMDLKFEIKPGNKSLDFKYISEISNRFNINTFVDVKFIKTFKDLKNGK